LYVVLYTFARFFFENMRIDPAHDIAGMRVNAWVSVFLFVFGVGWFAWLGRHEPEQRHPGDAPLDDANAPVGADGVS
jgi:prolipoprotein diacylglyceryltransferase